MACERCKQKLFTPFTVWLSSPGFTTPPFPGVAGAGFNTGALLQQIVDAIAQTADQRSSPSRVRTVSVAFPVSNDGSRLVPPLNARSAPIAPVRSICGSYSYPAYGQVKIPNDIKLLRKVLRLRTAAHRSAVLSDAGWSSPVARQAHNLKVISSNLVPATKIPKLIQQLMQSPAWLSPAGLLLVSATRVRFLGPFRNTNDVSRHRDRPPQGRPCAGCRPAGYSCRNAVINRAQASRRLGSLIAQRIMSARMG